MIIRSIKSEIQDGNGKTGIAYTCMALENGMPIAKVDLMRLQEPIPCIANLFVEESFRNNGIATTLIEHCINIAISEYAAKEVNLTAISDLVPFYEKRGFIKAYYYSSDKKYLMVKRVG